MDDRLVGSLLGVLWLGWVIYWGVAARNTKPTQRRESFASRCTYVAPLVVGGVLLTLHFPGNPLARSYLPPEVRPAAVWLGLVCCAAGQGFAIWARRSLAGNWSADVRIKEGHELIRTGPYRFVRHPIYTGLLLALVGTAVTEARFAGVVAIVFFVAGIVRKLTLEERWLSEVFPDYAAYKAAVPALIPLIY